MNTAQTLITQIVNYYKTPAIRRQIFALDLEIEENFE